MRPSITAISAWAVVAVIAAACGSFAPREVLVGMLSSCTLFAFTAMAAVMLICVLMLGGSRLSTAWRRPLGMIAQGLWFVPLLIVALIFGSVTLYRWNADAAFAAQRTFLNVPFFAVRAVLCGCALVGIALALNALRRPLHFAVVLLIVFAITNVIAFDGIMALTPHWHSSAFGLRCCVNGLLAAVALAIAWQARHDRGTGSEDFRARIDGATLLFALDLGWLYLAFVDYVTAWSGNLPDEVIWYAPRTQGAWGLVILGVVAVHALVGAALLLRIVKRSPAALFALAVLTIAVAYVEALWTVIPGTHVDTGIAVTVSLVVAVVVVGAGWSWQHLAKPHSTRIAHG